jgi:hypothetical protein
VEEPAQPILDYASPASQGKMRLPSNSVLDIQLLPDGIHVVERLYGKGGAVGGICFAIFVIVVLVITAFANSFSERGVIILLFTLAAIELVLMLLVINNTWRRTILSVNGPQLHLQFIAPLTGVREYRWTKDEIDRLAIEIYGRDRMADHLVIYLCTGQPVHLFIDHGLKELEIIRSAVEKAMM